MDFGREKEVFPLVLIQEGRVEKCTVLSLKNKREKTFLSFKTQLFHIQVVRYAASISILLFSSMNTLNYSDVIKRIIIRPVQGLLELLINVDFLSIFFETGIAKEYT